MAAAGAPGRRRMGALLPPMASLSAADRSVYQHYRSLALAYNCSKHQQSGRRRMGRPLACGLAWLALMLAIGAASDAPIDQAVAQHCGGPCPRRGAKASALALALHGSGAHRRLEYRLSLRCSQGNAQAGSSSGSSSGGDAAAAAACPQAAALLQPLPPAVFADVYELDNAAAAGRGPAVQLFGPVDVESIERYAAPTALAVYSNASSEAAAVAAAAAQGQVRLGSRRAQCMMIGA